MGRNYGLVSTKTWFFLVITGKLRTITGNYAITYTTGCFGSK